MQSEHEGYVAGRRHSPGVLLAIGAAHIALIVALALSPVRVIDENGVPTLIIEQIERPKLIPPPVETKRDRPRSSVRTDPRPRADPIPDTSTDLKPSDATSFPVDDTGTELGELGNATAIMPIDPPAPVVVGPQVDPRFARDLQPPYPPAMQRAELEGMVTVRVLVGTDGRVLRVEAVRTDQDAFLQATRDWALRKWRFRPATRDGVPIEEWRTMTVRFELDR